MWWMPRLFVWAEPPRFSWTLKKETGEGGEEALCVCVWWGLNESSV